MSGKNRPSTARLDVQNLLNRIARVVSFPQPGQNKDEWKDYLTLQSMVQELENLQKDKQYYTAPSDKMKKKNVESFRLWLETNQLDLNGLEISESEEMGLGLYAQNDIKSGDTMLEIPGDLMMTTAKALKTSADLAQWTEKSPLAKNIPGLVLSLFLYKESMSGASKWKPYIDILPRTFNNPYFYTMEESMQISGSHVLGSILRYFKAILRQYIQIYSDFKESPNPFIPLNKFTFGGFRWAVSVVMSRQNLIPGENENNIPNLALVPLWDLFNHEQAEDGKITSIYDSLKDAMVCSAPKNIKCGDQVFIKYGSRPNSELLLHMGYTLPNNRNDHVRFYVTLNTNDSLYEKRLTLCRKFAVVSTGCFDFTWKPLLKNYALLTYLHILHCSEAELDELVEKLEENIEETSDTLKLFHHSKEIQSRMYQWIKVKAMVLLKGYKTSLKDDQEILKELSTHASSSPRLKAGLLLRIGEKKLLEHIIAEVDKLTSKGQ